MLVCPGVKAQVTQRNLLQPYMAGLPAVLVARDAWKPFPLTPRGVDSTYIKAVLTGEMKAVF